MTREKTGLLAFLLCLLPACTGNPEKDALLVEFSTAAIAPIVGNYIRGKENPAKTAENIVLIAEGLKVLVSGEPVTLGKLLSFAQARYPSDYTIQEREEADAFLAALAAGLKAITLHGEPLGDNALVHLTSVLDMVSKTAGRYVVPQASLSDYKRLIYIRPSGYRRLGRVMWA